MAREELLEDFDNFPEQGPTTAQLDFIDGLQEQLGLDLGEVLEMAEDVVGRTINALRELTVPEASELIDALKERRHDERARR